LKGTQERRLLTGNEAIARGAYEAGVRVAAAYPGTPSTEILENVAGYPEIYSQWSVNEKVALEVASGASIAGARTLAVMKHVGLNVAADPFMTLSYTGVTGGLVLISADDPQLHSSQNEQDNRYYARFARVPLLEPSDSQEAKDFVAAALDVSEDYDTPVIVRSTTRISHSRSLVSTGPRREVPIKKYQKDCRKYVMIPAFGRIRHKAVLERWEELKKLSNNSKLNQVFKGDGSGSKTGIITSGVVFQYVMEVFPGLDILKLGMTSPIPEDVIREFARGRDNIVVIEELEPYLEEQLLAMDLDVRIIGKELFPLYGELSPAYLRKVEGKVTGSSKDIQSVPEEKSKKTREIQDVLPQRPPVLCAGCPHRPVFYILKKLKLKVMGDIGCYTLSVLPPLDSMDSCLCMGAGVGQALGMEKADPSLKGKVVSVIGDSTFFHSGMTPMVDNIYNKGTGIIIILDNRITAMTGHQVHPGVGKTLMGEETVTVNPEDIARAAGIKNVEVIDAYDMKAFEAAVKKQLEIDSISVIVARQRCILLDRKKPKANEVFIDQEKCQKCGLCIKFGCPAIELAGDTYTINSLQCSGCGVCVNICRSGAIICRSSS